MLKTPPRCPWAVGRGRSTASTPPPTRRPTGVQLLWPRERWTESFDCFQALRRVETYPCGRRRAPPASTGV